MNLDGDNLERNNLEHNNDLKRKHQIIKISIILLFTTLYFCVELIWGIKIYSLSLITDAMHMLSDVISLIIVIYSLIVTNRKNTSFKTYGWKRMEIVGGNINGVTLIVLSFSMILGAVERLINNEQGNLEGNGIILIIVASVGVAINLMGLSCLGGHSHSHSHDSTHSHSHSNNFNIQGLFLHLVGDTLGSICVIISGCIIQFTSSKYRFLADPIASILISIVIIVGTTPIVYKTTKILLQQVPSAIDLDKIKEEILKNNSIESIHEFHIWQLDSNRVIGTLHMNMTSNISCNEFMKICSEVKNIMHQHGIHNTTIQPEYIIIDEVSDDISNRMTINVPLKGTLKGSLSGSDSGDVEIPSVIRECSEPLCDQCADKRCC